MKHERFEDMKVWKDTRIFVKEIYKIPKSRFKNDYEFMNQLRRAAVSIALNIAEGHERRTNKDFAHFITMAKGSAGECRAALYLASDLGYISEAAHKELHTEVMKIIRQLSGFSNYLIKSAHK